jgi:hypothetical protein
MRARDYATRAKFCFYSARGITTARLKKVSLRVAIPRDLCYTLLINFGREEEMETVHTNGDFSVVSDEHIERYYITGDSIILGWSPDKETAIQRCDLLASY